jgi:hypothetical protein
MIYTLVVLSVMQVIAVGAITWWLVTGVWFRNPEPRLSDESKKYEPARRRTNGEVQ